MGTHELVYNLDYSFVVAGVVLQRVFLARSGEDLFCLTGTEHLSHVEARQGLLKLPARFVWESDNSTLEVVLPISPTAGFGR